jgi:predicted glycosyltransferase
LPLLLRWLEYPVYRVIRFVISFYDECWIPDFNDLQFNLSGKLSHRFPLPENTRFIGILSRFMGVKNDLQFSSRLKYDRVIILSGPEPQISILEKMAYKLSLEVEGRTLIINGVRGKTMPSISNGKTEVSVFPHLPEDEFMQVLLQAGSILCRSGYTGIMDMVALNKTALLIPTPGQCEQEYLAQYLGNKGWFPWVSQDSFSTTSMYSLTKDSSYAMQFTFGEELEKQIARLNSYKKYKDNSKVSNQKS